MADQKITELTAYTTPIPTDVLPIVDITTTATKKITLLNLGIIDGWVPASETWAYASATTITVPSGAASKYQKGDKIKLTQTTVKYFYVVGVADTVLTITGGTSYTLIDAAISLNYYSHQDNPIGFPHWFDWTPTYGAETGTWTSIVAAISEFKISGNMCFVRGAYEGTTNSSTAYLTITLPVTPANAGSECMTGIWRNGAGWNPHNLEFYSSVLRSTNSYTTGANRGFKVQGFYEIA